MGKYGENPLGKWIDIFSWENHTEENHREQEIEEFSSHV